MTTTHTEPVVRAAPRLHHLDNLRVALTVLVVLHHVAVGYSHIPEWYYHQTPHDPTASVLDGFIVLNQTFFMGLFFLISGFFTPGAVDRKGPGRFTRDRLLRLGVPWLVFVLVLRPLLTLPGFPGSGQSYGQYYLSTWDPGPTWFLEVLLIFALLYALIRRLRPARPGVSEPSAPSAVAIGGFALGLTAVTAAWHLVVPAGSYWPGIGLPTPDYLPQYASLFVLGVLAQRRGWATALTVRAGRCAGLAAAGTLALCGSGVLFASGPVAFLARAGLDAAFPVFLAISLAVLFRERWNRQRAAGKFLSDNAFAVYLLHPIPLVLLAAAITTLPLPALLKFALVSITALPLSWLLAATVRRLPTPRRFL
jgi:glucans biosynthesis protein C